jgi:hypothetical protein
MAPLLSLVLLFLSLPLYGQVRFDQKSDGVAIESITAVQLPPFWKAASHPVSTADHIRGLTQSRVSGRPLPRPTDKPHHRGLLIGAAR